MSWKMIVLNEPTQKFLVALKSARKRIGKCQREVAEALNLDESTYQKFELWLKRPSLENLMRLAKYFGHDLSESVNHKFFYRTIQPSDIKRKLRRYDLTYDELSDATGYSIDRISYSIRLKPEGSVACLFAVLEVIRHEQEAERFRREYCLTRRRKS